ncbi:MAG: chromosome partitioning protein [Gemmatimonadetes bacterium]|nr:chromosome partitioning protein [Gemmatimonadota bacterium]
MRTIAIANQKGGCGKTTTAINLAWELSNRDRRTLVVDMDPQGHVAIGFGLDTSDPRGTLFSLLLEEDPVTRLDTLLCEVEEDLFVVPSTLQLTMLEQRLVGKKHRESRLSSVLRDMEERFDYVLVDSPPNLGMLTFNALFACEEIVIPVEASVYSVEGLSRLMETVKLVEEHAGHEKSVRILRTSHDRRTRYARAIGDRLIETYSGQVYETPISRSVRFREAAERGGAIGALYPRSRGSADYSSLAADVLRSEDSASARAESNRQALESQHPIGERVLFTFAMPEASDVRLVGDFNNWDPSGVPMTKGLDGVWTGTVSLEPGAYQYRFLADGRWHRDPKNTRVVENAYGGRNSLVEVGIG